MQTTTPSAVDVEKSKILNQRLGPATSFIRFDHISINEGLSSPVITSILQDQVGFLWFGTPDGLNRYDGYSFTTYRHQGSDEFSLSDDWITSLAAGKDGAMWIGTHNGGVNYYDPQSGSFIHYLHNPTDSNSLINNMINSVLVDDQGNVWMGTNDGLSIFDPTTELFTHYTHDARDIHSINSNRILSIFQNKGGVLWLGTDAGLNRYEPSRAYFTQYNPDIDHKTAINCITQDQVDYLWLGTSTGLFRFEPGTTTFTSYQDEFMLQEEPINNNISALFTDHLGEIWIGSEYGLGLYNWLTSEFMMYRRRPGIMGTLSDDKILAVFEDEGGILWVGTNGGGLNKYHRGQNQFTYYQHDPENPNSLSNNMVTSVALDDQQNIWIGTYGGGLNLFNHESSDFIQFKHDPEDTNSLASDNVTALWVDRLGYLWIGTRLGLDQYDPVSDTFTHFSSRAIDVTSISSNLVNVIYEDHLGVIWIGTERGLNYFNRETGEFTRYLHDAEVPTSLSHNQITAVFNDGLNNFWVGTLYGGLNLLNRGAGEFTHYQNDPLTPLSVSSNSITTIFQDSNKRLWIGTSGGGLNQYLPDSDSFAPIPANESFPSNKIMGILEDDSENLWLSTDYGLVRFNPSSGLIKNYTIYNGLPNNEFNPRALIKDNKARMYLGGVYGLTLFAPEFLADNTYIPPLVLTSFTIDGQEMQKGTTLMPDSEFSLSWPHNSFEFEFVALDFTEPEKNQYAYQLVDFDSDWINLGNKRYGRYTNLPGGSYTLRLKGSNNDGLWNEQGLEIPITIYPAFWETGWFRSLLVIAVITLALGGYRLRVSSMEKRTRELETQVRERTREIDQRNQELEALYQADEKIHRSLNLNQALQTMVEVTSQLLKSEKCAIYLWDTDLKKWCMKAQHGFQSDSVNLLQYDKGEGTIGSAATSDDLIKVCVKKGDIDQYKESKVALKVFKKEGIRFFILIPIRIGVDTFGIFQAAFTSSEHCEESIPRLFQALSQRASLSIENALLFEQTKELAVIEERTRLAHDLHDSAKQKAFAAMARLGTARGLLKNDSESAQVHLHEAENLVFEVIQQLTFLIQEMYPLALKEQGLTAALREYAFEWESHNDIQIQLNVKNERRLKLNVEQTLYRIAQESLSNVARHSQATQVEVGLDFLENEILMCIKDNGQGFDPSQRPMGVGLRSMRERASRVNGELIIESAPHHGTKIMAKLPCDSTN